MYTLTQFMLLTTMVLVVLTAGAALTHERVWQYVLLLTHRLACKVINRVSVIIDGIDHAKENGFEPGRLGTAWYHRCLRIEGFWWRLDAKVHANLKPLVDDEGTFVEAD